MQPGQYVEPVQLQVICHNLWENLPAGGMQITEKDIQDVGDVNTSLGNYYADRVRAVAEAKSVSERRIREWFTDKLISPGGVRNMVLKEHGTKSSGLENDIILALPDLIRAEQRGGATFYELTHDRLVEPIITNNRKWEEEHYSPLQRQAALWNDQGRNDSWLLTGQALDDVKQWAKDHPDEVTEPEKEFLNACRAKHAEDIRLAREQFACRQRFVLIGVTTALVISVFLSIFTWMARNEATTAQKAAETSAAIAIQKEKEADTARANAKREANLARAGRLAAQSQVVLDDDPRLSLLLSIESLNLAVQEGQNNFPVAETVLRRAIEKVGNSLALTGHTLPIRALDFSSDGRWLVTGSEDRTIRLWDLTEEDPSTTSPAINVGTEVTSLPSVLRSGCWQVGTRISQLSVWDVTTENPSEIFTSFVGTGPIKVLAFSPDGNWLAAAASNDYNVQLWDTENQFGETTILSGHNGLISALVFSPDERWLATASNDSTIRVWDLSNTSAEPIVLSGHSGSIHALVFSPDERWLATASDDAIVRCLGYGRRHGQSHRTRYGFWPN